MTVHTGTVQQLAARVAPPPVRPGAARDAGSPRAADFAALLEQAGAPDVTVSAHASQRAGDRAIDLSEPVQRRIAEALDVLDAKGARDALLLGSEAAFVVSVPNRTVVTALDLGEMRDRAVTQIDSAFVL